MFTSKHVAVVHAQTTRMQRNTLCANGHLGSSGIHIEFEWIRKGLHFQINNPEWLFAMNTITI